MQGRRIVVTRAREQAASLVERLRELGAEPLECPAISIAPLEDFSQLDAAVARLDSYDWVIFTSVNGARALVSRLGAAGKSVGDLCTRRIAAIGPATEAELRQIGCEPAFVPDTYVAEAIIEQIDDVEGRCILLPRADIARQALATGLRERGATVDEVAAYRTVHAGGAGSLAALLSGGTIDAVTFTSSSTVRYTVEGMVEAGLDRAGAVEMLNRTAVVCIGPVTAATAADLGLRVSAVADEYTTEGLVSALVALFAGVEPVESAPANRKGDH
ncbi:MAG TPA: uroporphyrinogen-III synthase [Chloroflexia bacterium]|nr:uroporphyrinogen-III synthase [Chloroflexia bacterium]